VLTGPRGIANKLPDSVKVAALGSSLVLSAVLTAAVLRSPAHHWLAWVSFLPLFAVVRSLGCPVPSRGGGRSRPAKRPRHSSPSPTFRGCLKSGPRNRAVTVRERFLPPKPDRFLTGAARIRLLICPLRENGGAAALAGGFWGGCLYLFCSAGPARAIDPSAWLLTLLILIPALYVGLAARPARAIAFNLLTLALGWTLVEAVLHLHHPTAGREGLLTGAQSEGAQLHWLARLLGYVCTAFVVACANASLIGVLSGVRLIMPRVKSIGALANFEASLLSRISVYVRLLTVRETYPRAPPVEFSLRTLM